VCVLFFFFLSLSCTGHIERERYFKDYTMRRLRKDLIGAPIDIPDNTLHQFAYNTATSSGSNDLYNMNIVKTSPSRDSPGVGGFLPYDVSGEPPRSTVVYLSPRDGGGDSSVAVSSSDNDGYFDLSYRHRGPIEDFDVTVPEYSLRSGLRITNNNADEIVDLGLLLFDGGIPIVFNDEKE